MLFQHLLFISLNLYRTKVHIQYYEYIYNLHLIYNISPLLIRYIVFGYQKTNVEVLRHTAHEDTNRKVVQTVKLLSKEPITVV